MQKIRYFDFCLLGGSVFEGYMYDEMSRNFAGCHFPGAVVSDFTQQARREEIAADAEKEIVR